MVPSFLVTWWDLLEAPAGKRVLGAVGRSVASTPVLLRPCLLRCKERGRGDPTWILGRLVPYSGQQK